MTSAERHRKIEALRALIERPGTPAEGEAAKRALKRVMATEAEDEKPGYSSVFGNSGFRVDELFVADMLRELRREKKSSLEDLLRGEDIEMEVTFDARDMESALSEIERQFKAKRDS